MTPFSNFSSLKRHNRNKNCSFETKQLVTCGNGYPEPLLRRIYDFHSEMREISQFSILYHCPPEGNIGEALKSSTQTLKSCLARVMAEDGGIL